jgi:hypothetical protein
MNLRASSLFSAAVIALLAGCATAPPPSSATGGRPETSPAKTAIVRPETALKKGMTAAEVKRIMGEPVEKRPMKAPSGKAEVWVYHRSTNGLVKQVQVGSISTPLTTKSTSGAIVVLGSVNEPVFKQATEVLDETISLLMFDDIYIQISQSSEAHMVFN